MWIYVINIALILYWWFFYEITKKNRLKKDLTNEPIKKGIVGKTLLLLPFLQIYLMLSLKNTRIGTDTISYIHGFNLILNTTWQDIFNFKIPNLVFNFERGFIALSKFITIFTDNFTVYSFIIYAIMIFPLYKFIKKHSVMPFFSLILFITLGFLNFYFSGMRQAIAFSIVLLSYDYIVKRKLWRFLLLITIAILFHKSAIFFIPAYFLMNLTFTPLVGILYTISLVVLYGLRVQILGFITKYIYSDVEIVNTGAYTLLLIVFSTFIAGMLFYKQNIVKNKNNKLMYNLIAFAFALMIFNTASNIGLRAANYYYIYMILFIPNIIISSFKNKPIKYYAITIVLLFTSTYYFLIGVNNLNGTPYKFFWQ